jgi:hypothetical protein
LELFPQVHSFAKNKLISVHKAFSQDEFTNLFALHLSQVAFQQALNIQQKMGTIVLDEQVNDIWTYFGRASKFKSAVAYKKILGHHEIDRAFK